MTRDRRERHDPHDPPVPENVRRLRPAEVHNAPPGRRAPARDAASRYGAPAPAVDFATGKERAPRVGGAPGRPAGPGGVGGEPGRPGGPPSGGAPVARALPPGRSSPPPSAPVPGGPVEPTAPPVRTVGLKGRAPRPAPGENARRAPGAPRRLGLPVPVRVQAGAGGAPGRIEGERVEAVRESWLIEDRWWTDRPLRRRYWEVVTTAGRDSIVFRDLVDGRWYRQR